MVPVTCQHPDAGQYRPLGMKSAFPTRAGLVTWLRKPAIGPSSLRAVMVRCPGMTGHQGNLVPHLLAAQRVPYGRPAGSTPCTGTPTHKAVLPYQPCR